MCLQTVSCLWKSFARMDSLIWHTLIVRDLDGEMGLREAGLREEDSVEKQTWRGLIKAIGPRGIGKKNTVRSSVLGSVFKLLILFCTGTTIFSCNDLVYMTTWRVRYLANSTVSNASQYWWANIEEISGFFTNLWWSASTLGIISIHTNYLCLLLILSLRVVSWGLTNCFY